MPSPLVAFALSGIGRDALRLAIGLLLGLCIALAFSISSTMALFGVAAPGHTIAYAHLDEIPADQFPIIQAAAASCGLPWQVLAGVARVESGFGRDMATSSAGAIGYGQFLPSSWAAYGHGGNPYDFHDALPAMARYLCDSGAPGDLRRALFAYNHADWYVDRVLGAAARYGYLAPGSTTERLLAVARAQLGVPYVWGGASPETGFDCSGLVQWSYRQVGIALPRTAQQQFDATARVAPDDLRPADLVFFAGTYPSLERITHVGIYLGNGMMLNAPSEGDVVRELHVFSGYWRDHYAGAGRVVR